MRITSGKQRGRKLVVPKGQDIRPTTDKVRQAIFNMLQSYELPGDETVLDGFCGTGALGLEALSRGAAHCTFMDKETTTARKNSEALNLQEQCVIIKKDITKCGPRKENIPAANLVFLDPPYRKNLIQPALTALIKNDWLTPDALCVIECEKGTETNEPENFTLLTQKTYGDTQILIGRLSPAK